MTPIDITAPLEVELLRYADDAFRVANAEANAILDAAAARRTATWSGVLQAHGVELEGVAGLRVEDRPGGGFLIQVLDAEDVKRARVSPSPFKLKPEAEAHPEQPAA